MCNLSLCSSTAQQHVGDIGIHVNAKRKPRTATKSNFQKQSVQRSATKHFSHQHWTTGSQPSGLLHTADHAAHCHNSLKADNSHEELDRQLCRASLKKIPFRPRSKIIALASFFLRILLTDQCREHPGMMRSILIGQNRNTPRGVLVRPPNLGPISEHVLQYLLLKIWMGSKFEPQTRGPEGLCAAIRLRTGSHCSGTKRFGDIHSNRGCERQRQ